MSDGKVKEAYHIYFLLTMSSKHSKHNIDRIYKMIHG